MFTLKLGWNVRPGKEDREDGEMEWVETGCTCFKDATGHSFKIWPVFPNDSDFFFLPNNFGSNDKGAASSQLQMFAVSTKSGTLQLLHFTSDCKRWHRMLLTISFTPPLAWHANESESADICVSETFPLVSESFIFTTRLYAAAWCAEQSGSLYF